MDQVTHEMSEHHRAADSNSVTVIRQIPLWGIITALGLVALQAIGMYMKQERQGDVQTRLIESADRQSTQMTNLTEQIRLLSLQITATNVKDSEHDYKLQDLQRRIESVERERDRDRRGR